MLVGVDIGTTNVKAVAVDAAGVPLTAAERRNDIIVPNPGWSEQDPEAIFQNVLAVVQAVIQHPSVLEHAEPVQSIVFSAAMHGLLAVDAAGNPLSNVWLWSDLRADAAARALLAPEGLGTEIYRRTGVPIHPMSPLCKLIWMREHMPELFGAAHKFLGIKEFVWFRLTGKYESDLSCASATGLMNIWENTWDEEALRIAGIASEQLPALVPITGLANFREVENFPEVTHAVIGASDGALANLGAGAIHPGQLAVTIGTSAAIRCVVDAPLVDDAMRTFCYRLDEKRCIIGGASNNGTSVLEWLRSSVFRSDLSSEQFVNQAFEAPIGANGLLVLPYIQGERAPLWDARATGAFVGLTSLHSQAHFVRAALEGILFNLKIIAEALPQPINTLHASGGFSNNSGWVQMLADIFQVPVLLEERGMDASVAGAIQVGSLALGLKPMNLNLQPKKILPNRGNAKAYQETFQRFKSALSREGMGLK